MLTADEIRAMTPEQRTAALEQLAVGLFGATGWPKKLADAIEGSSGTVFRWRRENTTPLEVLLLLQCWAGGRDDAIRHEFYNSVAQLAQVTASLERLAQLVQPDAAPQPGTS